MICVAFFSFCMTLKLLQLLDLQTKLETQLDSNLERNLHCSSAQVIKLNPNSIDGIKQILQMLIKRFNKLLMSKMISRCIRRCTRRISPWSKSCRHRRNSADPSSSSVHSGAVAWRHGASSVPDKRAPGFCLAVSVTRLRPQSFQSFKDLWDRGISKKACKYRSCNTEDHLLLPTSFFSFSSLSSNCRIMIQLGLVLVLDAKFLLSRTSCLAISTSN